MRLPPLLFVAALMACSPTPPSTPATDVQVVRSQIDSLDARFNRWASTGQLDSIMTHYYAPDAIVVNAGVPPVRGREAIRAVYDGIFKTGNVRAHIGLTTILAADSIASDIGQYALEIRSKVDTAKVLMSDHGNYATTFVRRNGEWRALYDVTVSEVPMPAAPASSTVSGKAKQ